MKKKRIAVSRYGYTVFIKERLNISKMSVPYRITYRFNANENLARWFLNVYSQGLLGKKGRLCTSSFQTSESADIRMRWQWIREEQKGPIGWSRTLWKSYTSVGLLRDRGGLQVGRASPRGNWAFPKCLSHHRVSITSHLTPKVIALRVQSKAVEILEENRSGKGFFSWTTGYTSHDPKEGDYSWLC